MASHPSEATIVFVAYAGEEQGLYGSDHLAQVAKDEGWNVQGVLNMDIIGSSLGGNGVRDPRTIRLFSEGVPTAETPQQTAQRKTLGGENDGVSRQLARYVKETGENRSTGMKVKLVWRRDRYLRSGDQVSWLLRGWAGVRFTEPNENFDHEHQGRGWQAVRRPRAVRRLPVPRPRHARGGLVVGGAGALAAGAGEQPCHLLGTGL
jgi:hypothetical protein